MKNNCPTNKIPIDIMIKCNYLGRDIRGLELHSKPLGIILIDEQGIRCGKLVNGELKPLEIESISLNIKNESRI